MRHAPFRVDVDARDRWLTHMRAAVESLHLAPMHEAILWDYLDAPRGAWSTRWTDGGGRRRLQVMSGRPRHRPRVVVVAVVAALAAGGASSGASSQSSSASDTPAAVGPSSTGPCTGLDTVTAGDGRTYAQYPVSSSNSLGCSLVPGDKGEPVAALQRALALCKHQQVTADGVYGSQTSHAVAALGGSDGNYGPAVAKTMSWPWFSASTRSFTGRCSNSTTST